jgi:hypothetical protein
MTARERRQAGAARGNFIFAAVVLPGIAAVLLLVMAAGRAAEPAARAAVTPAQIAACAPDAQRFCLQHLGSREAVKACMIAHKPQLSETCRAAFR